MGYEFLYYGILALPTYIAQIMFDLNGKQITKNMNFEIVLLNNRS